MDIFWFCYLSGFYHWNLPRTWTAIWARLYSQILYRIHRVFSRNTSFGTAFYCILWVAKIWNKTFLSFCTKFKSIIHIIVPQALRIVIPPWSNELIYTLKYSSVAYIIGAPELMAQAKFIAAENFRYFEVFLVAAFIYLVIVSFLSWILRIIEERVKIPGLQSAQG